MRKPKQTIFIPIDDDEEGVAIAKRLLQRLQKIGNMNTTYSDVIEDILNHCDSCDQFWADKT